MRKSIINEVNFFHWKIENKYLPLVILKEKDGNNELINLIYSQKHQVQISDGAKEFYRIPSFALISPEVLSELVYYDYEVLNEQVNRAEVNDYTAEILNRTSLNLVHA